MSDASNSDTDDTDGTDDNNSDGNGADNDVEDTVLVGSNTNDIFIINNLDVVTTLLDFNVEGTDVIQFDSLTFDDLNLVQSDADTLIQVNNETVVIVANVDATTITEEVIVTVTGDER